MVTAQDPPQIEGIAFRPSSPIDNAYLAEVNARCIPRTEPSRFEREGKPAWTNLYFSDLMNATAVAFVCDYHLPESRDLAKRRRLLDESGGGRLGVLDAVELVISTRDTRAARSRWQRLFDPLEPAQSLTWRPAIGPAITLVEGDDERVDQFALAVRSPDVAHQVWREVAEWTTRRLMLTPSRSLREDHDALEWTTRTRGGKQLPGASVVSKNRRASTTG